MNWVGGPIHSMFTKEKTRMIRKSFDLLFCYHSNELIWTVESKLPSILIFLEVIK